MKKSSIFLMAILLSCTFLLAMPSASAASYEVVELWNNPMEVNDVAVSTDGQYIVAAGDKIIAFFSVDSSTPLWWYYNNSIAEYFLSVAISADGNQVIVGNNSMGGPPAGSIYYFDNCLSRSGLQSPDSYDWTSVHFLGLGTSSIERRTIDISANGEFVVVGGTGENLYYFRDCTSKSGSGLDFDWSIFAGYDVLCVDMTPDGRYVAFGGSSAGLAGYVWFTGNADLVGNHFTNWTSPTDSWIVDIAISNDGNAVAAAGFRPLTSLHYWVDTKSLTGIQADTWNNTNPSFTSVDVDSSGDRVVAGTEFEQFDGTLHFWDGALGMSGMGVTETWTQLHGMDVYDVGIDDGGQVVVATSGLPRYSGEFNTNFFTTDGTLVANFTTDDPGWVVSVAGDGNIVAVGAGPVAAGTLYVYRITTIVPVGGEILSLDGLILLAPYLAVVLVAGAVIAGVLAKRRVP